MKKMFRIFALLFAFVLAGAALTGCRQRQEGGSGGNEPIDMNDFPLYNEEYAAMDYTQEEYEQKMSQPYWSQPYWLGNVIYNELALPIAYEDGQAYANLLYKPLRVVSVMDQTLKTTYTEGVDYTRYAR